MKNASLLLSILLELICNVSARSNTSRKTICKPCTKPTPSCPSKEKKCKTKMTCSFDENLIYKNKDKCSSSSSSSSSSDSRCDKPSSCSSSSSSSSSSSKVCPKPIPSLNCSVDVEGTLKSIVTDFKSFVSTYGTVVKTDVKSFFSTINSLGSGFTPNIHMPNWEMFIRGLIDRGCHDIPMSAIDEISDIAENGIDEANNIVREDFKSGVSDLQTRADSMCDIDLPKFIASDLISGQLKMLSNKAFYDAVPIINSTTAKIQSTLLSYASGCCADTKMEILNFVDNLRKDFTEAYKRGLEELSHTITKERDELVEALKKLATSYANDIKSMTVEQINVLISRIFPLAKIHSDKSTTNSRQLSNGSKTCNNGTSGSTKPSNDNSSKQPNGKENENVPKTTVPTDKQTPPKRSLKIPFLPSNTGSS